MEMLVNGEEHVGATTSLTSFGIGVNLSARRSAVYPSQPSLIREGAIQNF
jgi:hypothetical protein